MDPSLAPFEPVIDLFLAGRLPRFNHARHVAVANILRQLPLGCPRERGRGPSARGRRRRRRGLNVRRSHW
jgi:hypothetical protein